MSEIVQNTFEALNDAGFTEENTIFVLCSDHGYPDPSRGITPEYLTQRNLTHDIFMTDDNIMIPMFLKYPGCKQGQKIEETVSSLDLMPTILDILQIPLADELTEKFHGVSLLPLLNGINKGDYRNRKIRSDARFVYQAGRVTALRGEKYKYVVHHDDQHEEFVYVGNNSLEEPSVLHLPNDEVKQAFADFKQAFRLSEANAFAAQEDYAAFQLSQTILKPALKLGSDISILLVGVVPVNVRKGIERHLTFELGDQGVSLEFVDDISKADKNSYTIIVTFGNGGSSAWGNKKITSRVKLRLDADKLASVSNTQKPRLLRMVDYFKLVWRNRDFYLNEPYLILYEPYEIFKRAFRIDYDYTQKKWTPRKFSK